jgi:hypothetical protein
MMRFAVQQKIAFNNKRWLFVPYQLLVNRIEIRFGEAQVINSIEQVGFTRTVFACKAVNRLAELKSFVGVVFKIV